MSEDIAGVAPPFVSLHASCVVVGDAGVLIRGASGAGKSRLAMEIVEDARVRGLFARLVGDDRIRVASRHGRLVARAHPAIAGRIERRGVGILAVAHLDAAVVRLVIDLAMGTTDGGLERLPDACASETTILGIRLPRLNSRAGDGIAPIALARAGGLSVTLMTESAYESA